MNKCAILDALNKLARGGKWGFDKIAREMSPLFHDMKSICIFWKTSRYHAPYNIWHYS
jgi:hypothetical protein